MNRHDPDDLLQRALDDALSPREKQVVAARVASDAAFAAEAAALHELNGYLAGVRSAEPPRGLVSSVMDEIGEADASAPRAAARRLSAAQEIGRADPAAAAWHSVFTSTVRPRYAGILLLGLGAALGAVVFWAAARLGPDLDAPRLASATIGNRAAPAGRVVAARDISQAGVQGRLELRAADAEWHVTATLSPTRPIPVSLRCEDGAPLAFTHTGEAVGLAVDEATVSWQQGAPGAVVVRFPRPSPAPASCIVTIDGTPHALRDSGP